MPRYVILRHETPPDDARLSHWDFMLEVGDALRTWALLEEPAIGRTMDAEALPDHRKQYLELEGPVSGGRGTVRRWDEGTYRIGSQRVDLIQLTLEGGRLQCGVTLHRQSAEPPRWRVVFCAA